MPVIDRHIINPNINYDGASRDDLFRLINRWKNLLVTKYDASKGQTLALAIITVNQNHIACIFAAAELGMKLLVITKPIIRETIHATKMGIFGPVDITVAQTFDEDDPHEEMVIRYSKKLCREEEIDTFFEDHDLPVSDIFPEDDLIFMSTSGTTGKSKPVMFSHREVHDISRRNISVFGFNKKSVVVHTASFHHVSSMLTFIIPALMVADKHFYGGIAWTPITMKTTYRPDEFVSRFIVEQKADMMMVNMTQAITWLADHIKNNLDKISHTVKFNTSGITLTEEFYQYARNLPIEIYSHYGSTETGIPLLVNHVTSQSRYEKNLLGKPMDDFYKIDGDIITCDLWDTPRSFPDKLCFENEKYYFQQRLEDYDTLLPGTADLFNEQLCDHTVVKTENIEKPFLIIWKAENTEYFHHKLSNSKTEIDKFFHQILHLNKLDFMVDTKVSMEQLRAYLEHHYAV